jgi:hypothetical protein
LARPSKPAAVIKTEKKSHRTKAELEARENAENGLLSNKKLQERKEVKENKTAHSEFQRVSKLMKAIGKDDALYSSGINTYCLLYAEIGNLTEQMKALDKTGDMLRESFERLVDDPESGIEPETIIQFEKSFTRLISQKLNISSMIDKKRKMMLDIDKENVMTISAALRSIPKQPETKENPIYAILRGDSDK